MDMLGLAASLGVGGFLGTLIFIMYRIDRKSIEKRMSKLLEEDVETRKENTKVLTELVTLITRLNGRPRN